MQRSFVFLLLALVAFASASSLDRQTGRKILLRGRTKAHAAQIVGRKGLAASPNVKNSLDENLSTTRTFMPSSNIVKLEAVARRDIGDVHPMLYYQQHANRAIARLARMTGRSLTPGHLEDNLRKRWVQVGLPLGQKTKRSSTPDAPASRMEKKHRRDVSSTASPGIIATASESLSAAIAGNTAASVGDSITGENSGGFSQAELDAVQDNTDTPGPANVGNVLGLSIESNDVGYFATMQVGTPPRDFRILTDSGSADFWLASQACQVCSKTHQRLGSQTSSTFKATNTPFNVTYGSGAVSGFIIQDNVFIGNLSLPAHTFGVTTQQTPDFSAATVLFDGLMGTAKSQLSNQQVPTPIESLAKIGAVASAQMGYALGRFADGNNQGTVTFGGVNQAQIAGQLLELPNVSQIGFFEVALDDASVDGTSLAFKGRTAILDTGTTLIIMPQADATAVHAAIPGATGPDDQGSFTVPCNTQVDLAFTFGGKAFSLDPSDLAFLPVSDDLKTCQSGIMAGSIGAETEWLVGDVFLKSVYYATDVNTNTVGLAPQKK